MSRIMHFLVLVILFSFLLAGCSSKQEQAMPIETETVNTTISDTLPKETETTSTLEETTEPSEETEPTVETIEETYATTPPTEEMPEIDEGVAGPNDTPIL